MLEIFLLPAAEADYQSAVAWYRIRSEQTSRRFEAAISDGLQHIARDPLSYEFIDDRHRRFIVRRFPYSLIYRIDTEGVVVIAVVHSRRSETYWRGRA